MHEQVAHLRRQVLIYSPAVARPRVAIQTLPYRVQSTAMGWEKTKKAFLVCTLPDNPPKIQRRVSPCFISHPVRSAPCQNSTSPVKVLFPFPKRLLRAVPIPS